MKTITKIIGIGIIALIAMTCIGAVSAEPVERTVLGNAWIYDIGVTDDFDYFIYDGTEDAVSASANDLTRDQIDELLNEIGGNQNIGGTEKIIVGAWNYEPCPVPVIPDHELRSVNEVIGDWDMGDHDSASETHDDPSADHADDHSDSESKNINTGLNRDRF